MRPAYVPGSLSLPSPPPSGGPDDPEHPLTCLGLCRLHVEQKAACGTKGRRNKGTTWERLQIKLNISQYLLQLLSFLSSPNFLSVNRAAI